MRAVPSEERGPSVVAALRLDGERFVARGTPVTALSEVVAFQALLSEIAKAHHRRDNRRRRVRAGFDERLDIRLDHIEGGSSIPVLTRPADLADPDSTVFEDIDFPDVLDVARKDIEDFIDAAARGSDWPPIFQELAAPVVKRFGQTLSDGDSLQVAATPALIRASTIARYTRQTRRSVLLRLSGTYTDVATFDGTVYDLRLGQQSFSLRSTDGHTVAAPYTDESFRTLIESVEPVPTAIFRVSGIAEHGADDRPIKFLSIDRLDRLETVLLADSYEEAVRELQAASRLEAGWLDGEIGSPVTVPARTLGRALLQAMQNAQLTAPIVYPTELGGLQFEWTVSIFAISLEIDASADMIHLHSTNTDTVQYEARHVTADIPGYAVAMDWLMERLENS